jgi:hypothetical protein
MAAELILEFEGVTAKEYYAVNKALGIDVESGEGDWPEGMISHAAGLREDGHFVVTEVWNSVKDQEAFMSRRLSSALAEGGIAGPPSKVTWIELIQHRNLGS